MLLSLWPFWHWCRYTGVVDPDLDPNWIRILILNISEINIYIWVSSFVGQSKRTSERFLWLFCAHCRWNGWLCWLLLSSPPNLCRWRRLMASHSGTRTRWPALKGPTSPYRIENKRSLGYSAKWQTTTATAHAWTKLQHMQPFCGCRAWV